ncbi:hypothetical protein ACVWYQ_002310 [Bradyrhizobium sp. USDA 3397]
MQIRPRRAPRGTASARVGCRGDLFNSRGRAIAWSDFCNGHPSRRPPSAGLRMRIEGATPDAASQQKCENNPMHSRPPLSEQGLAGMDEVFSDLRNKFWHVGQNSGILAPSQQSRASGLQGCANPDAVAHKPFIHISKFAFARSAPAPPRRTRHVTTALSHPITSPLAANDRGAPAANPIAVRRPDPQAGERHQSFSLTSQMSGSAGSGLTSKPSCRHMSSMTVFSCSTSPDMVFNPSDRA